MSRIRRPALVASFKQWSLDWTQAAAAQQRAALRSTAAGREASLRDERDGLKARVASLQAELEKRIELEKRVATTEADTQGSLLSQLEAQAAKEAREREQRIEHLGGMFARRVLKRDIARGWTAWREVWTDRVQSQRVLQRVVSRLRQPERSAAFSAWKDDWERAMRTQAQKQLSEAANTREERLATERDEAVAALARFKEEAEERAGLAEMKMQLALERQAVELTGTYDERQKVLAEQDKEERVEHLRRQIARRILNQDLVRGWSAWYELWEVKGAQSRLLHRVASRLCKPMLTWCFRFWHEDWTKEQMALEVAKSHSVQAELVQLRYQVWQH